MEQSLPDEVRKIIKTVSKAGFQIYIIGGAVRDILMKKNVSDWDFTTSANPKEILKLFPNAFYDNAFGTVGIPSTNPQFKPHEITTFRREFGYSDKRRPDRVEWGKSLEEDLSRRDFTINAMALLFPQTKSTKAQIIDPFGGQKDLNDKIIRAVRDPNERFSEDALRMARAVRIASQLGFTIEENTKNAIITNSTLITKIAKERVRDELLKILSSPNPYQGIVTLREVGLLEQILPELEKAFGIEQQSPQRHHLYDVGTHSLLSLKYCRAEDPITRLATLIHDIGKPQTFKKQKNGVITFYNHEVVGAKTAERIADRLRLSNKQKDKLLHLVRWHQFTVDEFQTDSAVRRFIRNVGIENVEDMLELRRADRLGSGARETSWRTEEFKERLIEVQRQPFTVHDLKISGHDIMKELNLKPGPKVGEILQKLYDEVVEKHLPNEKKALTQRLKER